MVTRRAWTIGRRGAAALAAFVGVAAAMGCQAETSIPERTIRVAVSTDVPDAFDTLRITVARGGAIKFNESYDRATIDALPDSLLLRNGMPFDDQGHEIITPIQVRVAGLSSEGPLVIERSAELIFVIDRPVLLRMPLCEDCLGVLCGEGQTCVLSKCVDESVDAASLPGDDGTESLESIECPSASP
jgi:hypothetical protein